MGGVTISDELFLRLICGADRTGRGVILSDDALAAAIEIVEKAQKPLKREKKDLTGDNIAKYIAAAKLVIDKAQADFDRGGKLISKRQFAKAIHLDESTVRKNVTLNSIYERFKRDNCNASPLTLNNDPNSYLEEWD